MDCKFSYKISPTLNSFIKIKDKFLLIVFIFFLLTYVLAIITNLSLYFGVNKQLVFLISLILIVFGFFKPIYIKKLKIIFKK